MTAKSKPRRKFGKTNRYPEGKLNEHDEGEIRFGVAHHAGEVILDFGTPVKWLAMPPALARQIAEMLRRHADEIEQAATREGN